MLRSRKIRIAAYIGGGLVVILGLVLAGVHTPPARRFVLRQVIVILREQGIGFDASSLDYNLFGLRVELRNVRVQSRQTPDLPALLTADRIAVVVNLPKLIGGAYYIEDAAIERPQVRLVVDRDGRDNVPRPPAKQKTPGTSAAVDWLVREARISGGAVNVEERKQQIAVAVPLQQITMEGDAASKHHQIRIRTQDGGSVALSSRTLPLRGFGGEFVLEQNAVQVQRLGAQFGESSVSVSGRLNGFDNLALDLRVRAAVMLAPLAEFAGISQKVSGKLDVAVQAGGSLARLKATAQVHGEQLTLDRFDNVSVQAAALYDAATSRVTLESLQVGSPWGTVRGTGDVALTAAAGQSKVSIEAAGVSLARLSSTLKLPVAIASIGTAKVDARWPALEFESAAGDASLKLVASQSAPAKNVVPVDATIAATVRGNRIVADLNGVRSLGATAAGQVTLTDRKSVSGELQVDAAHLSTVVAAAEAFLGKDAGTLAGTPIEGSLRSTVSLAGNVDAPTADLKMEVPDLSAGELHAIAVKVAASYAPERVTIADASVNWQNQTVHAAGTVGLGKQQNLRITAKADAISVASVLAGLNRTDLPLTGNVDLTAEVNGTTDSPQASVVVAGSGMHAYQENLGTLRMQGQLQGRQVEVSELRIEKPQPNTDGLVRASGGFNLDSKQFHVAAQVQHVELLNFAMADGNWARGTIDIDVTGQGTVDDPTGEVKLTADGVRVGDQDFGRVELTAKAAGQAVEAQASAPKFQATASGKVGIHDPYPATAQVKLSQMDLAQLPLKMEEPLEGTLSAVVDASGDLQNYKQGKARVEVSQLDVKFQGEPVRSDGPLVASYANGTLTVEKAAILAADSRLEASGSLPLESTAAEGAVNVQAQLKLPGLARFAPGDLELKLEGTASIAGSIRGSLQKIDPTLAIALENAAVSLKGLSPGVTNATLHGQVRDGALELESASAKWGAADFQAAGTIPFALLPADLPVELPRRQGPAKLTAELKGVNLASLPGVPASLQGMVSAHVEAEAARPELEAVKATLTFPQLQAKLDTYAVAQDGISEIGLENGVARVKRLRLIGPSTEVALSGTAEVAGAQALNLQLDGKLDASLASAFTDAVRARGATEIHAAVSGTVKEPQAKGFLQLADGQVSLQQPRIGIEGLNVRVDLDATRATISKLEGQINGGTLSGKGSVGYADGTLKNADLSVEADDLYLDFPAGLKTVSDLRLQLKSVEERLALRGSVLIKEGGFTDDLNFDKGILAVATAPRSLDLTERRNPLLDSMRLNISVVTQDPIVVENNLAKAEISAQLVVLGTPYEPGLAGRLTIEEGSELTLQERKYEVSRGVITFTNDRRIEPSMDIEATTSASNYDITLQISGPPGDTKTQLTSNPTLPEPDIMAILVTGKTLDEIRGQEFQVAQTQMLSYLTGRLGSSIGHELEKATGLSRVRVEPNLIAAEANPGARLTVGQDINRQLKVVYSMDLVNSSDQIYIAEYDLTKRFVSRGVRQSDGTYRFDFHHDVQFGGVGEVKRGKTQDGRRIGSVFIVGDDYFTEDKLRGMLKVKPGDRYDFFKIRRGLDRVNHQYFKADLLESNIHLKREQKATAVNLSLKIDPGPKVKFVYEGASVPGSVSKQVRQVWYDGVFDMQRGEDAAGVLRAWMVRQKRLTPQITPEITAPANDQKHVVFDIQLGPKYESVEWVFDGAHGMDAKRLRDVIESQKLTTDVYTKPTRVTDLLTQFYREMGYLDAAVQNPRYELKAETATGKVVFPVKEGPLYHVGEAHFVGNTALTQDELAEAVPLPRGEGYRPSLRENAIQRLREAYWARGYNEVETDAEVEHVAERGVVNLNFHITENTRSVVQEVVVEGNGKTSESLIRSQLEVKPGDPVNLQKISNSRRKLYNTGAFSLVDITEEDVTQASASPAPVSATKTMRVGVRVHEVQPFEVSYGGFFDTERGPGGLVDFSNRNSLGSARVLGFRGRYDSQLQEARLYFSQPLLAGHSIKTIASPYLRREINPETDLTAGFNVDRVGFSVQQEVTLGKKILFDYGYKIERSRTYDTGPDPIFDIYLRVASLTATFSRDTRDDILDAAKGSFFSHALQFSPETLGSQVRFVKYSGQYFRYIPLQKPRVELFTNQVIRPRLVYATGLRVGLATGLGGQEVPLSERFFAGGATTIRGFTQNSVGPVSGGTQLGGAGLLVINNELRFPLIKLLDGAGFVDIGNVYAKVSDFSVTDLRKAAGAGLRVRTPWFLIRLDYGFNLDRRTGEPSGRVFFSIGQAF